jgi:DNA repair protein RadC
MNQSVFTFDDSPQGHHFTIACGERPQERMENFGVTALSDTELIAMVLQGNGTRPEQALAVASRLIADAGSILGLASWQPADYRQRSAIGRVKGLQLSAIAEIARRMMTARTEASPLMNRADLVAAYFQPIAMGLEVEKFWVLCLNRKNRLLKRVEITSGTATAALAHPREVFRAAIRECASSIICVHNHPSGDPAPSAPDMHVTRQLREAAKAVDITLLDHVIVGRADADPLARGHFSFREAGML